MVLIACGMKTYNIVWDLLKPRDLAVSVCPLSSDLLKIKLRCKILIAKY